MVELEPEEREEASRWSAAEARQFLSATAADPLGLMLRIVVPRGARRGEAIGSRWADADLDAGYLTVDRPILQVGGTLSERKPKNRAGAREDLAGPSRRHAAAAATGKPSSPTGLRASTA